MKLFGMGVPELLIILAVVLLIFGPKHLPKLGAALGSTVKNLREGLGSSKSEAEEEVVDMEEDEEQEAPAQKALKAAPAKRTVVKKVVAAEQ